MMMDSPTVINILKARKTNGLFNSIITGERGVGKTSYSLQTLYLVFRKLGYDKEEAWQMSLDRCLYTIPDIVDFLEQSNKKKHKDCFIWDDAGVFAGGVRWYTHYKEMVLLESVSDVLRNMVYGLLLTVPDIRTLTRRLRSYDDYIIKIYYPKPKSKGEKFDPNLRHARVYKKGMSPIGQVNLSKKYYDSFNIMLPDWVYKKYQAKRNKYGLNDLKQLKKLSKID